MLASFLVSRLVQNQMSEGDLRLEIYTNGQLYQTINLSEANTEEIMVPNKDGHDNVVEIANGEARVKKADCPNQMCVHTGWISRPGQMAVCTPNKFNMVVKGKNNKEVDAVSY